MNACQTNFNNAPVSHVTRSKKGVKRKMKTDTGRKVLGVHNLDPRQNRDSNPRENDTERKDKKERDALQRISLSAPLSGQ